MSRPVLKSDAVPRELFSESLIKAPKIRLVYDYWLSLGQGMGGPSPDDIDILELSQAIGSVSFIDVTDQSPRFRLRMVGSEVVARYGRDLTGHYVDELEDEEARDKLLSSYGETFARREPFWIERRVFEGEHLYVHECLILPLWDSKGQVVRLMSVLDWPDAPSNM